MVARTAFTQLNYSPLLLLSTVLAMTLIYLVSPVATAWGGLTENWLIAFAGLSGWLLMAGAYFPILMFYQCSPLLAFCLPIIALFYTLMTVDSSTASLGRKRRCLGREGNILETGDWGAGETGRWGDGETGRRGE